MVITQSQRVASFVDVQNLYYSAKYQYNGKVNFEKLIHKTTRERALIRAIAYLVETEEIDQSRFLETLGELGYEVQTKQLRTRPDGSAKGDWDMGIAIDAISIGSKVDVVCLVSGDGDFVDLVEMLKGDGLRVEVFSFPSSTANELQEAATEYYAMDDDYLL
ncbi:MAG: NYN domain-containing protein [bacterium]